MAQNTSTWRDKPGLASSHARTDPRHFRELVRKGQYRSATSGCCQDYLQANLIVLPAKYADDFRALCQRNPVPCPLLGETVLGDPTRFEPSLLAEGANIATDIPFYSVYQDSKLIDHQTSIKDLWTDDHIGFLIGCSYSFEDALAREGLPPRYFGTRKSVPMYVSNILLCPSGVFGGTYVVSMRPYKIEDIARVRSICRRYNTCHGEPIVWGWDKVNSIGIEDLTKPDFGESVDIKEDEIPVFWGCGVTPQWSVLQSHIDGPVFGHKPGHMFVTDIHG